MESTQRLQSLLLRETEIWVEIPRLVPVLLSPVLPGWTRLQSEVTHARVASTLWGELRFVSTT